MPVHIEDGSGRPTSPPPTTTTTGPTATMPNHRPQQQPQRPQRDSIIISNLPKLILACVFLVCVTVLLALGSIEATAGAGMLGVASGYIFGNGLTAARQRRNPDDGGEL